jgi:hypothetical protein
METEERPPPVVPDPPETPPAGEDPGTAHPLSMEGLNSRIDQLFDLLRGRGRGAGDKPGEPDVAATVREEVAKLRAADDEHRRRTGLGARIDELETALKAFTEKKPVEHRPITKLMWGDKSDG